MHKKIRESAMLRPDEAHAILGTDKISRRAFYNALKRNEIPNRRCGRRILIPRAAFMQYVEGAGASGGVA
jgi:excisionase family DNA binding protein